jgi:hypothetical protein
MRRVSLRPAILLTFIACGCAAHGPRAADREPVADPDIVVHNRTADIVTVFFVYASGGASRRLGTVGPARSANFTVPAHALPQSRVQLFARVGSGQAPPFLGTSHSSSVPARQEMREGREFATYPFATPRNGMIEWEVEPGNPFSAVVVR